jgi:hypothetical protein
MRTNQITLKQTSGMAQTPGGESCDSLGLQICHLVVVLNPVDDDTNLFVGNGPLADNNFLL